MVCLQHRPGPIWMSAEMQDLSKQFHSLTNYLHHFPLVTPVTPNKWTNLIPCYLTAYVSCWCQHQTHSVACVCCQGYHLFGHYLLYTSLITVLHLCRSDNWTVNICCAVLSSILYWSLNWIIRCANWKCVSLSLTLWTMTFCVSAP